MIEFQKKKYKNFLSSGNYFTEIQLNRDNDTLIVGSNGKLIEIDRSKKKITLYFW